MNRIREDEFEELLFVKEATEKLDVDSHVLAEYAVEVALARYGENIVKSLYGEPSVVTELRKENVDVEFESATEAIEYLQDKTKKSVESEKEIATGKIAKEFIDLDSRLRGIDAKIKTEQGTKDVSKLTEKRRKIIKRFNEIREQYDVSGIFDDDV